MSPDDAYTGTYCLRCGAHWNHAGEDPASPRSAETPNG